MRANFKQHMSWKRIFAVLLCLFTCIGFIPNVALAAESTINVTSQDDITDALNKAAAGDSITFVLQNDVELGSAPEAKQIVIKEGVTAALINASGVPVKVSRLLKDNSYFSVAGALSISQDTANGGSLTFDGSVELLGSVIFPDFTDKPLFSVSGEGSKLTINGGTFTNNKSNFGVIYSTNGAVTTINGGIFSHNANDAAGLQGGVIAAANSQLTIAGGTFSNNTAKGSGGAIYFEGRGHSLYVEGGTFEGNTSGGLFGGAIFVDSGSFAEFSGGTFIKNKGQTGGAVYIDKGAQAKMHNIVVCKNTAAGEGGGIWNCPTGGSNGYNFNGMYIAENEAKTAGDDFFSKDKEDNPVYVNVADYSFNGKRFNWTKDEETARRSGEVPAGSYYQATNKYCAIKSGLSAGDKPAGAVVFLENTAIDGGAIANNGMLNIGDATAAAVKKTTTETTADIFTFNVELKLNDAALPGCFVCKSSTGTLESVTFDTAGKAAITAASGETKTFIDIPMGATYAFSEAGKAGWALKDSADTSGAVAQQNTPATFVNTPTGSLSVSKTVSGGGASYDKEFDFIVQLIDKDGNPISGTYGDMTFVNGEASFKLKGGDTKTAAGLPAGAVYTVSEDSAGYTPTIKLNGRSAAMAAGTIEGKKTSAAEFNNYKPGADAGSYTPEPAKVTITASKTLDNIAPAGSDFSFVLQDESGKTVQTVRNNGGSVIFDTLTFLKTGAFRYTLSEAPGTDGKISYDDTKYTVVISVTRSGDYHAAVSYEKDGAAYSGVPAFSNTTKTPVGGEDGDKTTVSVQKLWDDNSSASRPGSVTVRLYKDGVAYGASVQLDSASNWKFEWTDLDNSAVWTVDEPAVSDGYVKAVSNQGNSWTITNKLIYISSTDDPTPSDTPDTSDKTSGIDNVPQTGDPSHTMRWLALAMGSLVGLAAVIFAGKKKAWAPRHSKQRAVRGGKNQ